MKNKKKVLISTNFASFCIKDDSQKYKPYSQMYKVQFFYPFCLKAEGVTPFIFLKNLVR